MDLSPYWYNPRKTILKHHAHYNIVYSERSIGKTTGILIYALEELVASNYVKQLAIIRRWDTDFTGYKGPLMFHVLNEIGIVDELTKGRFNNITYTSDRWFLQKISDDGKILEKLKEPFAVKFSLNLEEHYKSVPFPNITTVLFDEYTTRATYLANEFVILENLLSTIIRVRDNVTVFLCGNTINKYCPHHAEMGLKNIKYQKKGTIDIYKYADSDLKVAVEYADFPSDKKPSNVYFAFNNPKLKMITKGDWEIGMYPHLPVKYRPKDVLSKFYLIFDEETLQGNLIRVDDCFMLYFHRKTTPIKDNNKYTVYQQESDYRRNYRVNILKPMTVIDKKIYWMIERGKTFYQDNEVGEIVNNYIKWCKNTIAKIDK